MPSTVLVVDDDESNRSAVRQKLEENDYVVEEAKDGFEGLSKARKIEPTLILLNANLPVMSGLKMSRLLKFDTRYQNIPILMMLDDNDQVSNELCMAVGAMVVLPKPMDMDQLIQRIEQNLATL